MDKPRAEDQAQLNPPAESLRQRALRSLMGVVMGAAILGGSSFVAHYFWTNQPEAARKKPKRKAPHVYAMRLTQTNFPVIIPSQGRTQSATNSAILPEVTGRIVKLAPEFVAGGFFRAGQPLVWLDARVYTNAVAQAHAEIQQLTNSLALVHINANSYSNAVALARSNLSQAESAVQEADANLALEKARQTAAELNLKLLKKLAEATELARNIPQVRKAEAALKAAKASQQASQAALDKALVDLNQRQPNEERDLLAQLAVATNRLARVVIDAERTVIRAPDFDGLIVEKHADLGQSVAPGKELARALATGVAEVPLPVANLRLGYLDLPPLPGASQTTNSVQPPQVELSAVIGGRTNTWSGAIVRTQERYDPASQQLFLVAQVRQPYASRPPLRAGQFVRARIHGRVLENVYKLPRSAVRRGNEVALAVKTDKGYILQRREIEVLWRERGVIVTSSLEEGDVLITSPIEYATNEEPIVPLIDGEPPPGGRPSRAP